MNRFQGFGFITGLAIVGLAFGAGTADAAGQWGVAGFAGYDSYAMEDVNDEISDANDELEFFGFSERIDDISSGIAFGGGLRYRTASGLIIGADYERLTASSDVSISGPGGSATVEIDAGGSAFTGTVNYLFPSASRSRFGIAAGIGYYTSSGSVSADLGGSTASDDISGNGFGFHGGGTVDVALGQVARLEVLAGYRIAKASDIEVAGVSTDSEIDWSGFMSRIGLAFYFGAQ